MLPFNDPFAPNSPGSNANGSNSPPIRHNSSLTNMTDPSQHSLSSQSSTTGDAFSRREQGSENMYIRQKEMDM